MFEPAHERDPGWWPALRRLPLAPFPLLARLGTANGHPLTHIRLMYCSFVVSLVLIGAILAFLFAGSQATNESWINPALIVYGVCAFLLTRMFWKKPLAGESPAAILGTYRSAMFLTLAVAMTPALWAFVLSFLTNSLATYLLGVAVGLPSLYLAAPRSRDLERRQVQLYERGLSIDLLESLGGAARPR
jgi:hypothetical protein